MTDPYLELLQAEDPYPIVHRLRTEDPVHWTPLGFWFVTRHDDVKRLFHDPENATGDRKAWEHFEPQPEGSLLRASEENNFFSMPPEEHARIRKLVSKAFTPRAIRRMDGQIREVVEQVAEPLRAQAGEAVDLMGSFTNLVPVLVISRLTGIPPGEDEDRFRELAQAAIQGFLPLTPQELKTKANLALEELTSWVRQIYAERRREPREDLISDLIQAQEGNDQLGEDEIVMLISGIVAAGSETTAIGGMAVIMTLLQHPEALQRLRDDRTLIPKAIDEVLRWTFGGPAGLPRYAVRDFELRGRQIKKGQMLMLSFAGANRDPAAYDDPDTLDLDRDVKDLLVFGNGPHYCLGANLARQEMGCMLDALLDLIPPGSTVRLEEMEFQDNGMFKRPMNLPVQIGARARLTDGDGLNS